MVAVLSYVTDGESMKPAWCALLSLETPGSRSNCKMTMEKAVAWGCDL